MERRLVVVVRADPVICGHSGEARNLAEAAVERGFEDVRILTWPLPVLEASGLPLKPIDSVQPYSPPIVVERPEPVGDYRVPDARYASGLKSRLIEIVGDGIETVVLSLYLLPHSSVVTEAIAAARETWLPVRVRSAAEAVGSDVTNVVRGCIERGDYGAALYVFGVYLSHDLCLAVSSYTRDLIIESAERVDAACGTTLAARCRERVAVSYPAIHTDELTDTDPDWANGMLHRRGLARDGFVLFLSRLSEAKGVHDLLEAYRRSQCSHDRPLVLAGNGPALADLDRLTRDDPRVHVLTDVDDDEKRALMQGCSAYVLPSKPRPEFVETFGIALAEKLLCGGPGPVITTNTGGIPEAVGDAALIVEAGNVDSIARTLDHAVLEMDDVEKQRLAWRGRSHALRFDRRRVLDELLSRLPPAAPSEAAVG